MAQAKTRSFTIPPPVKGWNARDPISMMDEQFAVEMINYFPDASDVKLRNGYRYHSKSVGNGTVGQMAEFYYGSTRKFVASLYDSAAKVYDITTAQAAGTNITGAAVITQAMIHFQQFRDRIFMSNAAEQVHQWTGSGNISASPYSTTPVAGPLASYKSRFYQVEASTNSLWYSAVDSTGGALTEFPISSQLLKGGKVVFIGPLTRAKESVEDELFCIITDQGEVVLYQGNSPADTSVWSIVGHYFIPPPRSVKSFFRFGADILIITDLGVVSLLKVMRGDDIIYITDLISNAFRDVIQSYPTGSSQGIYYPRGGMIIINVESALNTFIQFVQNVVTGAWCKFTNINAYSWALFMNDPYFAGDSARVFKFNTGYFDEDPANEGAVLTRPTKLRPAYNYFGNRATEKQFTQANVIVSESEGLSLTVNADVDFENTTATSTVSDTSDTSYKLYNVTAGLTGIGKCASIRFDGNVTTKRRAIQAIEVYFNEGGI